MGKGNKTAGQILAELGPMGVWGGLGTRIIMIGTLTGLQWYVHGVNMTAVSHMLLGGVLINALPSLHTQKHTQK